MGSRGAAPADNADFRQPYEQPLQLFPCHGPPCLQCPDQCTHHLSDGRVTYSKTPEKKAGFTKKGPDRPVAVGDDDSFLISSYDLALKFFMDFSHAPVRPAGHIDIRCMIFICMGS